jgi:hypothetical protein
MPLQFQFQGQPLGPQLRHGLERAQARIRQTIELTLREASSIILQRGRADIAAGIRATTRWTHGLHADVTIGRTLSTISISHDVPYWTIFQRGGVIKGKPLLWIPLPFAGDALGVRARDFPGGLFRVDRKSGGAPLLLSRADARPKYFGKASVTIPKKFHIFEIVREVARNLRAIYSKHFRNLTASD